MEKPTLVILAAGMGSRYGGLKQIDPVDDKGHKIIDFSIYDAVRAGFGKVVFIIKREHEQDFRECIGNAVSKHIPVEYVFQELTKVPEGFQIPEGRVKPWGTAHAILCCKGVVNEPFAVINADDYYGRSAFEELYRFLTTHHDDEKYRYAMVGYQLGNTLTDNGSVARGICVTDENGYLQEIAERTKIVKTEDGGRVRSCSVVHYRGRSAIRRGWLFVRCLSLCCGRSAIRHGRGYRPAQPFHLLSLSLQKASALPSNQRPALSAADKKFPMGTAFCQAVLSRSRARKSLRTAVFPCRAAV